MRRDAIGAALALAVCGAPAAARADREYTSATPEPVAGVDTLLVRPTTTALAAALSTSQKSTEFRATFLPAQFIDTAYSWLFSELRIVALADTSSSLTRFAVSTGYNPFSFRSARGFEVISAANAAVDCSDFEPGTPAMEQCNRKRVAAQWPLLNSGWIPSVFVTLSYDLYPYGRTPSTSDPSMDVALEPNGGPGTQLALEFRPQERVRLSAWGTLKYVRPDGGVGTRQSTYVGGGGTVSFLLWSFLPARPEDYPDDYIQEGFIPGLAAGASVQAVHCDGDQYCARLRTSQLSVTPFIDLLGSAKLQLRVSFPFIRYESVDKSGTDVGGTFSIAGAIGSP